jgi:hypothetical protein
MPESITVTWSWQPVGNLRLQGGKLLFPEVPNVPGIHRMTFTRASGEPAGIYIGEGYPLPRRFNGYRNPGPSQQTNLRLNPIMTGTLAEGGRMALEIATQAHISIAGNDLTPLSLADKAARVLVERAAETRARTAGLQVHNR